MVTKIRLFANHRLHGGHQPASEWTLERVIEMALDKGIMSLEEVAATGGWSVSTVRDKKLVMDFRHAVFSVGGPERMTDACLRVVAKHAKLRDFVDAPESMCGFFNDIRRMKMSADDSEPYIEEFFNINRSKGSVFSQFRTKLAEFHEDEDVTCRLADPARRGGTMTAEGRLIKQLKALQTVASDILNKKEAVGGFDRFYHRITGIRKTIQQIERMNKKKRKP